MAARVQMGRRDELRLSPGSNFKYNARMSLALLPCALVMFSMGGKAVLGTLAVGLMISYILDALQIKRGAFFGVWGTLGALGVAYGLSGLNMSTSGSWALQALAFLVLMQLVFLLGVWASLQFRWLQLENPSVVLALERLLFACTPFVAATCQTWAVVVALGVQHAAFYLMPIQFLLYWLFSLPAASSFKSERNYGGQISEGSIIMGPLEACLHTLMLLFLPLLLHIGVHHRNPAAVNTMCEIGLLFFVPLLFQLVASRKGALWWLVSDPRDLRQLQVVNGAVSAVGIVLLLEVRVVFYAFHQYIQLPAPWSYLLVTAASLAALASGGYCLLGSVRRSYLTALLLAAGVCSGLVLGMPLKLLPAPAVSAVLLAYYATGAGLLCYLGFVAATAICMVWFMVHHFWSLNVWIGGAPLKSACTLIISSAIVAISIPGLSALITGNLRYLVDVALGVHSLLVINLESRLFNFTSLYYFGMEEDVVYPSYIVVATTTVGLVLTRKMKAQSRISTLASWFIFCCYSCKLSMLLLPSKGVLWCSCLLLLATSAPVLLYSERMKPWRGVAHSVLNFLVVASCNHALSEAIVSWSGQHPSPSLLLGAVIFVAGLASAPIVVYHFNHVQLARRVLSLVLVGGTLFVLLQPPLPWGAGQRPWPIEDESFYAKSSTPRWPTWLLLLSALASLAASSSVLPVQHFVRLRLAYAVTLGSSLAVYACVQYLSGGVFAVQALLVTALACASVVVVFLLLPSTSSPRFVPWLFGLVVALLPVMYVLEGQQQVEDQEEAEERLLLSALAVKGGRTLLLGLYAALFMLIALVVKLQLSSISKDGSSKQQQYRKPRQASGLGVRRKVATADGAWMPAIGNAAALCCFLLCMVLNQQVAGGSHRAIVLLAPILLLLNQDSTLLPSFGDRQRYFPLTAVISVYLALIAVGRIWQEAWHEPGLGAVHTTKNMLLLLLTLPNHAMFNAFMWSHSLSPASQQHLWTSPLCLPALVATDVSAIRALALLAILYALIQHLVYRHVRTAGLKYI